MACDGRAIHQGIESKNLKLPPFLFLNFLVKGVPGNYYNDIESSCVLDEDLCLGVSRFKLLSSILTSNKHFFAICKFFGKFYNLDDMIFSYAKGYPSFKEAFDGRSHKSAIKFDLSRSSGNPKKGAVYSAIFQGLDTEDQTRLEWQEKTKNFRILRDVPKNIFKNFAGNEIQWQCSIETSCSVNRVVKRDILEDGKMDISFSTLDMASGPDGENNVNVDTEKHVLSSGESDSLDGGERGPQHLTDDEHGDEDDDHLSDDEHEVILNHEFDVGEDSCSSDIDKECEMIIFQEKQSINHIRKCDDHNSNFDLDYRLMTNQHIGRYMKNNPGSYYDHSRNLWFCSICQNFGGRGKENNAWSSTGVILGDAPGRKFKKHFRSDFHKRNVEFKAQFGNMMQKEKPSHIIALFNQYKSGENDKISKNRKVFKTLFRAAHFIIKKMMANDTFSSLVNLIADCDSFKLKQFIMKSPKNATYLSTFAFKKILKVLNDFTEEKLLKSLQSANYVTLFHDETTDVSNFSEAAVYVMFFHDGSHTEHFLGLKHMKNGLTAFDHYVATAELCKEKGLNMAKIQFVDLDGCNTNSGDMQGFKLYFKHCNPHNINQTCTSHTLALIPKHLITDSKFKAIYDADRLMVNLYVFFKNSSIMLNMFEKCQIVFEDKILKLICPSATRWLSHIICFERILVLFEPTLTTLAQIYHERNNLEALGLLVQLVDPTFMLSVLMLVDVLRTIRPLVLWLQSSPSSVDVTELPALVTRVVERLNYIAGDDRDQPRLFSKSGEDVLLFNIETFEEKYGIVVANIETLPAAARLRNSSKSREQGLNSRFEEFKTSVQQPFVTEIAQEIREKICLDPITSALKCLDVRFFPLFKSELSNFGKDSIRILSEHFGEPRQAMNPKTKVINRCDPKIDKIGTEAEYELFKLYAFDINSERSGEIRRKIRSIERRLSSTLKIPANQSEIKDLKQKMKELESSINKMTLAEMYKKLCSPTRAYLFPNILVLLEMAILCPVGNATVERLFSFMKIVKTRLRNLLSDCSLDSLLRVKLECKDHLDDEDLDELVDRFKEYSIQLSKSGKIRVDL